MYEITKYNVGANLLIPIHSSHNPLHFFLGTQCSEILKSLSFMMDQLMRGNLND